ncbi:MAG: methionine ABC transporter permease [Eubacteriales bacterium]|jgi:D-methionine transport system permease protein|nr:ABC transporter permease [Oscillospiraceae bacterium]MDO4422320.1 methionine ABC transporter permease [Eubacteriales bacterium]
MSDYIRDAIITGVWETFVMTFFASLFSYAVGMPLGVLLYATSKGRLLENRPVNFIIGAIVNITRSLPFLILLVLLIPFTRFIVGQSIGTTAAIVPLTIGAIPIVARMVESSLNEVQPGIIEAATSMGASPLYTIIHFIIPEATPSLLQGGAINVATVLGYSAMAGVIGGGGLGAIALQYGYYRYQKDVLFTTVALLIIMVMLIQEIGIFMSKKNRKT